MFTVETSSNWVIGDDLIKMLGFIVLIFLIYFFSFQLQVYLSKILHVVNKKMGIFSATREYALQKYIYQNSSSIIAKLYNWINAQLVALSLKRIGVSVVGYALFWAIVAFIITCLIVVFTNFGMAMFPLLFLVIFIMILVITRVVVSERMERREADVMNAIDLIVPEARNGIKNAISAYMDNFAPSVRDDFQAFIINIQDRGYTFEDAMYILADSLGLVFRDFAQKAIYFEAVGEREMVEIFNDITETNRLRRQLRDENNNAFTELRGSFIISVVMVVGYFFFLMFTDEFSRNFFLVQNEGKLLLIVIIGVVFGVLAFITTIKSGTI